jgi:hypothetical protein
MNQFTRDVYCFHTLNIFGQKIEKKLFILQVKIEKNYSENKNFFYELQMEQCLIFYEKGICERKKNRTLSIGTSKKFL